METVWWWFCYYLAELPPEFEAKVHAFVLMSNHYHLVLSTPLGNLDKIMHYLQRSTAIALNAASGRKNHLYGGPYSRTLITSDRQFGYTMKYVYRNPVEAGLSPDVESYPYSSLRFSLEPGSHPFQLQGVGSTTREAFHQQNQKLLTWYNQDGGPKQRECIRRALHRATFELKPLRGSTKLPEGLEAG